MKFNDFLEEERWSVAKIAKEFNVPVPTVAKWKHNGVIPRKELVVKIYEFTEGRVTPNDFYGIK